MAAPEHVELVAQSGQPGEVDPVEPSWTIYSNVDKTGVTQHAKMLTGRRLSHFGERGELTHRPLFLHDQFNDASSSRVRNGFQSNLHIHFEYYMNRI